MNRIDGKIGDVVIDRTYRKDGELAIIVGTDISQPIVLTHQSDILMYRLVNRYTTWEGLEKIGHINFEQVWEQAKAICYPNNDGDGKRNR